MKRVLVVLFCIFTAVLCVTGCAVKRQQADRITVFADSGTQESLRELAGEFTGSTGISVTFRFGSTAEMAEALRGSGEADLVVLYGEAQAKALVKGKNIDNYLMVTGDASQSIDGYFVAKAIDSGKYAEAQQFADLILSEKGKSRIDGNAAASK